MSELHKAARRGDLQRVKSLVEKGADVNTRDNDGETPLHEAASEGYLEVARFLVERGADVNAKDNHGLTPLHAAASEGYPEIAQLLVEKGANITVRDNDGLTPLHLAAVFGHLEVARFLVEKGADVNAKDNHGLTPLHAAALFGHLEVARFLLEAGADPTLRDEWGRTPADLAREQGFGGVAKLLEDWVGEVRAPLIASIESVGLVEGEWGVLRVRLNRPSKLVVEGDLDWVDPGLVEGVVEVPVKARKTGRIPVAIVAKSSGREERKVVWVEVSRGVCPSCKAPIEPGARYCWKCGAYLA